MSDELTIDESWRSDKAHEVICDAAERIANCYCSEDDTFETEKRRLTVAISRVVDRADLKMEEALKELREMFPKSWVYVTMQVTGDCSPRGKREIETSVLVQVDSNQGDIIYNDMQDSLSEAMKSIRAFKQSQGQER